MLKVVTAGLLELFACNHVCNHAKNDQHIHDHTMSLLKQQDAETADLGPLADATIAQTFQMMREKSYISSLILPTCSNISFIKYLWACHGTHVGRF